MQFASTFGAAAIYNSPMRFQSALMTTHTTHMFTHPTQLTRCCRGLIEKIGFGVESCRRRKLNLFNFQLKKTDVAVFLLLSHTVSSQIWCLMFVLYSSLGVFWLYFSVVFWAARNIENIEYSWIQISSLEINSFLQFVFNKTPIYLNQNNGHHLTQDTTCSQFERSQHSLGRRALIHTHTHEMH